MTNPNSTPNECAGGGTRSAESEREALARIIAPDEFNPNRCDGPFSQRARDVARQTADSILGAGFTRQPSHQSQPAPIAHLGHERPEFLPIVEDLRETVARLERERDEARANLRHANEYHERELSAARADRYEAEDREKNAQVRIASLKAEVAALRDAAIAAAEAMRERCAGVCGEGERHLHTRPETGNTAEDMEVYYRWMEAAKLADAIKRLPVTGETT